MANYTLNFDNAYADCLNVTLINFKANADCIEYAFSITQITLNISKTSYSIYIANSNTRICTQSNLSAYSNSFNIAITQSIMHSVEAINLIHFATSITQDCSHYSFIANSKALLFTLLFDFLLVLMALLLIYRSGVKVCVRKSILLQFIADILWILLLVILRLLVMQF